MDGAESKKAKDRATAGRVFMGKRLGRRKDERMRLKHTAQQESDGLLCFQCILQGDIPLSPVLE
jgi:hypothetical protein